VVLQFADVKKDITISLAKVLSKDALPDVNRKLHLIVLKDLDLNQDLDLDHKIYQIDLPLQLFKLETHAHPVLVAQMLNAMFKDKELFVHAEQTHLETLIQTVRLILAHKTHVVLMLYVKIQVQELFANVHQALLVIHSFGVMTIPAQLTPVVPTQIVKHKETELYVVAEKVMKAIRLSNVA